MRVSRALVTTMIDMFRGSGRVPLALTGPCAITVMDRVLLAVSKAVAAGDIEVEHAEPAA